MGHHHHHNNHQSGKNLKIAFLLNLGFTILEVIGGLYVNSLAIISDAVHDLGDSFSLGLSWYLDKKSKQRPDKKFTFGYARFSLLGAALNSIILVVSAVFIIYEAFGRLADPQHADAQGMIWFALLGIAVNGYAAWKLSGGNSMNEKVVSWHLIEDVLGWVAILIIAIVLKFKDIPWLDPALSLVITAYILWNVVKRLKETVFIFLQGTPTDLDVAEIESKILRVTYVDGVHDTRVWSLEGEQHVISTHVKLKNISSLDQLHAVKTEIKKTLSSYPFRHYTIETELADESCGLPPPEHTE